MRTNRVQIKIQTLEEGTADILHLIDDLKAGKKPKPQNVLAFETLEAMRKFLTPQRQLLLRVVRRMKPTSVYELAKTLGRERKAVAEDLKVLEDLGLIAFRTSIHDGRARSQPIAKFDGADIHVSW
jgi:predicted transcriptional regulator